MKINLSHDELVAIVQNEIKSMGLQGDPYVEFMPRRGGGLDAVIDLNKTTDTAVAEEPTVDSDESDEQTY